MEDLLRVFCYCTQSTKHFYFCVQILFSPLDAATRTEKDITLNEKLYKFSIEHNLSTQAINDLLKLFRDLNIDVPPSAYMLKKRKNHTVPKSINVANGKFTYISIKENLEFLKLNNRISWKKGLN